LDIRCDVVSAVLVRKGIRGTSVEAHEQVRFTDQKEPETTVSESLETITKNMDIAGSECAVSLPADLVSFRNIKVPFQDLKKIRQILPFELEPALPVAVEDVIVDFQPVYLNERNGDTNIIAAAIEKSQVRKYLDTLSSFNIEPDIVTIGGYAVALCLAHLVGIPENRLLIDMGGEKSILFVVASNQTCLIRPLPMVSPSSSGKKIVPINVRRTLSAIDEIYPADIQPRHIMLTGGGIDDTEAMRHMDQILKIPMQPLNLAKATNIVKKIRPDTPWQPALMDSALALALLKVEGIKGINFCKGAFIPKKESTERKKNLMITGFLIGLVLILAFMSSLLDFRSMEKKVSDLDNQITHIFQTTFPRINTIVDPVQQMRVNIEDLKKKSLFFGQAEKTIRHIDILNEISKQIPKETDIEITRLVIGEGDMTISGQTNTFNSVDDTKSKLETSGVFSQVKIDSANIDRSGNRVQFRLTIKL
ncbi:MAG: type II secretion system protein GspL, partial [Desulfobacterales bacterium]